MHRLFCILILAFCLSAGIQAQRIGVKTNLLHWATASPNAGVEFVLGKHLTLNVEASVNPFKHSELSLRHATLMPELRYWTGRALSRHFIGLAAGVSKYDVVLDHTRRNGNALTAGLTYGYNFVLSEHWNLELTAGAGVVRYSQFKYDTGADQPKTPATGYAFAPLKAGVSFVYVIH